MLAIIIRIMLQFAPNVCPGMQYLPARLNSRWAHYISSMDWMCAFL